MSTIKILTCRLTKGICLNHMGLNQFKMTFKTPVDRKYVSQDYQKSREIKYSMWYNSQMGSRPAAQFSLAFWGISNSLLSAIKPDT